MYLLVKTTQSLYHPVLLCYSGHFEKTALDGNKVGRHATITSIRANAEAKHIHLAHHIVIMFTHLPWPLLILLCLTLGLAPYSPQPHLIEKVIMLTQYKLTRPVDIFDLLLHASPWLLLLTKLFLTIFSRGK